MHVCVYDCVYMTLKVRHSEVQEQWTSSVSEREGPREGAVGNGGQRLLHVLLVSHWKNVNVRSLCQGSLQNLYYFSYSIFRLSIFQILVSVLSISVNICLETHI